MKIKGYDFVIKNLNAEKPNGYKIVETFCASEAMCLKLIDKYCPVPSDKTLIICARTEDEDEED